MANLINILNRSAGEARWRDLETAVLEAFQRSVGVSDASWPPATPLAELLGWLDQTIAEMRTPHGISGFLLIVFCDENQDHAIELTCTSRDLWPALREGLAPTLEHLVGQHTITLTMLSFGTAFAVVLD